MTAFILKETKDRGKGLFTTRYITRGEPSFHIDLRKQKRFTLEVLMFAMGGDWG